MGADTGLSWVLGAGTGLLAFSGSLAGGGFSVPFLQETWCLCRSTAGDWLAGTGGGGLEGGVSMAESDVL